MDEHSRCSTLDASTRCTLLRWIETLPAAVRNRGERVIFFLLACFGIVETITTGLIFKPLRELLARTIPALGKLIACPMCLAWYVGGSLALAGVSPRPTGRVLVDVFVAAGAASGVCWAAHVALVRLGSREL